MSTLLFTTPIIFLSLWYLISISCFRSAALSIISISRHSTQFSPTFYPWDHLVDVDFSTLPDDFDQQPYTLLNIPKSEFQALEDLYNSTEGENWYWFANEELTGIPWNFTGGYEAHNPCEEGWQHLECSCVLQLGINGVHPLGVYTEYHVRLSNYFYYYYDDTYAYYQGQNIENNNPNSSYVISCSIVKLHLISIGLRGEVPRSLSDLNNLTHLHLSVNELTGSTMHEIIPAFSKLRRLSLVDNLLSGPCPLFEVDQMMSLETAYLNNNLFTGQLPQEAHFSKENFPSLTVLQLTGNALTGRLTTNLLKNSMIENACLGQNSISGTVPSMLCSTPYQRHIYLNDNLLTGKIPENMISEDCIGITKFYLYNNQLTGKLPEDFMVPSVSAIWDLQIHNNHLSGQMPSGMFGNDCALSYVDINSNRFTGSIPREITKCKSMDVFMASLNLFSGTFPEYVIQPSLKFFFYGGQDRDSLIHGTLEGLERHMRSYNSSTPFKLSQLLIMLTNMDGTLPSQAFWGTYFPNLEALILIYSQFSGPIPDDICTLNKLISLRLYLNSFTGTVPDCIPDMPSLQQIQAATNQLDGNIGCKWITAQHQLQEIDFSYNQLTGPLFEDCPLQDRILNKELRLLTLGNNLLTGTIPLKLIRSERLATLFLAGNILTGFQSVDDYLDLHSTASNNSIPLFRSSILIFSIDNNPMNGRFPIEWLSLLPNIEYFVASSSCLFADDSKVPIGNVLTSMCENNPKMKVLSLDGTNANCDAISSSSSLTSRANLNDWGIPSCILQGNVMQNLTTLSLSGAGINGPFPNISTLPKTLLEFKVTRNQITGNVPNIIQLHPWNALDLSHNKISGRLYEYTNYLSNSSLSSVESSSIDLSHASITLVANRLSSKIPDIYSEAKWKSITILEGNLFGCSLDQHELPEQDQGMSSYSCGSNALNALLIIWIVLAVFATFIDKVKELTDPHAAAHGTMYAMYIRYEVAWQWLTSWLKSLAKKTADVKPNNVSDHSLSSSILDGSLKALIISVHLVSKMLLVCIFICIPIYVGLGTTYKTHYNAYAYELSSAYFSGVAPSIIFYILWSIIIFILFRVYYKLSLFNVSSQTSDVASSGIANKSSSVTSTATYTTKEMLLIFVIVGFVCSSLFIGIILINIGFLYTQIHFPLSLRIACQCAMSICKLLLVRIVLPTVFKSMFNVLSWLELGENTQVFLKLQDYYQLGLQIVFGVILNVIAPCVATAIYDINCFYNLFIQQPDKVVTHYTIPTCTNLDLDSSEYNCLEISEINYSSSFQPHFSYSYLCTSALLSNYCFVFVFMVLIDGSVKPLIRSVMKGIINLVASKKMKEDIAKKSKGCQILLTFQQEAVLSTIVNYSAILFTFGITFAPLGILICLYMMASITDYYTELLEYVNNLSNLSFFASMPIEWFPTLKNSTDDGHRKHSWEDVKIVKAALIKLSEQKFKYFVKGFCMMLLCLIIPMSIILFSWFIIDILGDTVGWRIAVLSVCLVNIAVVVVVLCYNVIMWNRNSKDQVAVSPVISKAVDPSDPVEKNDVESGSAKDKEEVRQARPTRRVVVAARTTQVVPVGLDAALSAAATATQLVAHSHEIELMMEMIEQHEQLYDVGVDVIITIVAFLVSL